MNRQTRRAAKSLDRAGTRRPWEPFERVPEIGREAMFERHRERIGDLLSFWKNNIYSVQVFRRHHEIGEVLQLVVRRHDEEPVEGWDDLQRIKNALAGEGRVAIEIYPEHDEVVDQAPLRHLFVLPIGVDAPFTIQGRWA